MKIAAGVFVCLLTLVGSARSVWAGPAGIDAGLKLWLKADAGVVADASTGLVSAWMDQSGNGLDLTSYSSGKPTLITSALNGKQVLRFDGTDGMIRDPVAGFSLAGAHEMTVFTVENIHGDYGSVLGWGYSSQDRIVIHTPWQQIHFQFGTDNTWGGTYWSPPSGWFDNPHINEFSADGALADYRVDGTSQGISTRTSEAFDGTRFESLRIGNDQFGNGLKGDLAEIIVFDRVLTSSEQDAVYDYISEKWFGTSPAVPEPGTMLLLGMGLSFIAMRRKARR